MRTIKERILLIANNCGIRKETFFNELGFSYANFRGAQKNKPISSESIEKVLSVYKDINPTWLITGEGSMLRKEIERIEESENVKILKEQIQEQKYYIEFLLEQNNKMNCHIEKLINKLT